MGDHIITKGRPRLELEELYRGIPDESVNLTFQDLANVENHALERRIEPISHESNKIISDPTKVPSPFISPNPSPPMLKLPSLDFSKGLQASINNNQSHDHNRHHHDFGHDGGGDHDSSSWGHFGRGGVKDDRGHDHSSYASEYSMSGVSVASGKGGAGGRRRRPGIPHSKICTICSNYIYLFRTRCLVCGRVYCRQCVEIGMGEMIEGRKCVECLGLRFSQRYIERAGKVGCCSWRYPSTMKQTEIKWAEKGPRRNGEKGYGPHGMGPSSRPRTPVTPRSPLSVASNEPSFVMSATYSPFSPHNLPL